MKEAMFKMAREALDAAAAMNVNVFCFQEAWSECLIYLKVENNTFNEFSQICRLRFAPEKSTRGVNMLKLRNMDQPPRFCKK